ncbi:hypothetical protein EIP91_011443 [Steccherinum ochraceum]|uniref:RRM domain-containing protein n=1 Tax=Steccherinum ochraceum TaxID=92696 RepID=A0A4R0RPT5_9APHY|nr:hypothetical protein EIP91_011443 [Steccherinum ochraceum]
MSDLDADLYGGKFYLYGNDEPEFAVPTGQAEDPAVKSEPEKHETVKKETTPPPQPSAPAAASSSADSSKPSLQVSVKQEPEPHTINAISPQSQVPVYTSPTTQQIPTYQERQDNDYSEMAPQRSDTGYPSDRPVRPSEMKEEGLLLVEGLRKYFTQFGKVEACTIMRDAAGRSRCFAFLTFEDPASVNAVMVREHFLDGKIIDPKRAIPRQEHQRATKLFIGGLAGTVTSESMREFFSQFGKVVDSTVMLDRETGRSKGFGFVSFEGANVEPILGFGNLEIDGKLIDVKLAQPRSQRENFTENGASNVGSGMGRGGGQFNNQFTTQTAAYGGNVSPPSQAQTGSNFDPQALASLYTRMFQQMGGMNPMMGGMGGMGGMGMMSGGGGGMFNGGMGGGMRMGMGANPMAAGGMMGMGGMGGNAGMGMGRGNAGMGATAAAGMGGGMNPGMNVPRGPRGAPTGPGGAGVGPQRAGQRGQHNYHPYAR